MQSLKSIIFENSPVFLRKAWRNKRQKEEYNNWEQNGKIGPSPHLRKQQIIKEYQKKSGITTLIETGTYLGYMIDAQKNAFNELHTIELGEELYKKAVKKYKNDNHIHLYCGDSGKVLPNILGKLNKPAIFWLDGHYSGGITAKGDKECPIYEELEAIFKNNKEHIILIDDARCFIGQDDYPTLNELSIFIKKNRPNHQMNVSDDIIRIIQNES